MNRREPLALQVAIVDSSSAWERCLEDEDNGMVLHAFTWSPNPGRFTSNEPIKQFEQCVINGIAPNIRCLRHYGFFPEFSQQGNIHIHGFYTVDDPIRYHKGFLPRLKNQGYVKIKKGRIDYKWFEYVTKDLEEMVFVLDESIISVPYTDEDPTDYFRLKRIHHVYAKFYKKKKPIIVRKPITDWVIFDSDSE